MRGIWRFYLDERAQWRWQRLSTNKVVIAESQVAFADYKQCVEDAHGKGYLLDSAEAKLKRMRGERSLVGTSYDLLVAGETIPASDVTASRHNPNSL
jgi:hypothetical protein